MAARLAWVHTSGGSSTAPRGRADPAALADLGARHRDLGGGGRAGPVGRRCGRDHPWGRRFAAPVSDRLRVAAPGRAATRVAGPTRPAVGGESPRAAAPGTVPVDR